MAQICQTGIMIVARFNIDEAFSLFQFRHRNAVALEIAGQGNGSVIQQQADAGGGCPDFVDFPSVQVLGHLPGVHFADLADHPGIKTFCAGIDAGLLLVQGNHIAQCKVHINNVGPPDQFVHIGVCLLVAPEIQRTVIHQDGAGLETTGHLFDMGHVQFAVPHHVRNRLQVRIVPDDIVHIILGKPVAAPSVKLSVFPDGDDMIRAGSHICDFGVFDLFRDLFHINASSADTSDPPYIHFPVFGQTDGEAAITVNGLDVVLQFSRDIHEIQGGGQVLLGGLRKSVIILRHKVRCDKHHSEHNQDHDHGKNGELPFQEPRKNLTSRADDQFRIIRFLAVLRFRSFALFIFPEPFFFIFRPEEPADKPAGKNMEYVFFFLHISCPPYLLMRTRGSTRP